MCLLLGSWRRRVLLTAGRSGEGFTAPGDKPPSEKDRASHASQNSYLKPGLIYSSSTSFPLHVTADIRRRHPEPRRSEPHLFGANVVDAAAQRFAERAQFMSGGGAAFCPETRAAGTGYRCSTNQSSRLSREPITGRTLPPCARDAHTRHQARD